MQQINVVKGCGGKSLIQENERLKELLEQYLRENNRLARQNKELRAAGDALVALVENDQELLGAIAQPAIEAALENWRAL
jgi:hypothetical protein